MKYYTFYITIGGYGHAPEEALNEAIESFSLNSFDIDDVDRYTEDEVEEE